MKVKIFIWAVLYNAAYIVGQYSRCAYLTELLVVIYTALFIAWLFRTGQNISAGITLKNIKRDKLWVTVPLFMLMVYNLCTSGGYTPALSSVVLMFCVAVTEEVFFRGVLPQFFWKKSLLRAIVLSNILFSMYHLTNISGETIVNYVVLQMLLSFAVGLCYSFTAAIHKSTVPCIIAHFFTNITGNAVYTVKGTEVIWLVFLAAIYLLYSIYLFKSNKSLFT